MPSPDPPSDAEGAGDEAGPDQSATLESSKPEPTKTAHFGRHNRWRCCATDRVRQPCPACCRCWEPCDCPTNAPMEVVIGW